MQYYTKQQLQGAGKYTSPCRNGNWNEDDVNDEHLLKDYLQKKTKGELKLNTLRFRMERALGPVTPSVIADDGLVHFGDMFQVANMMHDVFLSADTEDPDPRPMEHSCNISASKDHSPSMRNTFLMVKYTPPPKVYDAYKNSDEVLHYGQQFYMIANPGLFGEKVDDAGGTQPWYLRSVQLSSTHFSKLAAHQEVSLTHVKGYDCVWQVTDPDPSLRYKLEGQPVKAGVPVMLEHSNTKQHLNVEDLQYWNEFGYEYEVSAHSTARYHRVQVLKKMIGGTPNDLLKKSQEESNNWCFKSCSNVCRLEPSKGIPDMKPLLVKLNRQLAKLGVNGYASLRKCFTGFDVNSNGQLDFDEFMQAMAFCGLAMSKQEGADMLKTFDSNNSGTIDFDEFMNTLKKVDDISA
uniref:EF-hand domain-containing protein n=1 Tax=Pyramimonas obovata TaxID=1411642 RepID=A0A7S0MXH9_9CHLO|mmetsp:Transcript_14271/g.30567  ORF Transcript_14271/g.30567 Transcript_14271/m.30567 type:complete len:405 (+) Transcript_14271:132-1346(+)|eukprot:CAMPEP_0118936062 /NCGR_PEP_ID=MMETSP1169-20130426/15986_1 /TAXON_ID=36882 /ORGANISM="Pyramimonas obovata, Strain CCMP722" /LENGTH=404 /DNA_ID=CAMNT_0006879167 /DNA_START=132 /DNA_END=1346 /DNA_ORIENTATION=-